MRISICDNDGESFSEITHIPRKKFEDSGMDTQTANIVKLGPVADISSFFVKYYNSQKLAEKKEGLECDFINTVISKYPGSFFMLYPSKFGNTISFPNAVLYLEVINNGASIAQILSYDCHMLLRYDHGGIREVSEAPSGGRKYYYKPSGKIIEKWHKLHSMGLLGDNIYYPMNGKLEQCRRFNLTKNSFDALIKNTQILPGKSIDGLIFLEFENDELRLQQPRILGIELTIRTSAGKQQIFRVDEPELPPIADSIRIDDSQIVPGVYDITKDKYTLIPMVDIPKK